MIISWIQMGMPITLNVCDSFITESDIAFVKNYFRSIDERFSPYKKNSELSQINNGTISPDNYSREMREVLYKSEQTKIDTDGYFDIYHNDKIDTSGLVKGWANYNASNLLKRRGFTNFYIDAGGDIEVSGYNAHKKEWRIGIRNPFNQREIIKRVFLTNKGIATSGSYNRGNHVYNPKNNGHQLDDVVSITVIGPNVYEADRFATAAFAMGSKGIYFIETLPGFEAYQIDKDGKAVSTSHFEDYIV